MLKRLTKPTTGSLGCCARTVSGHAAAPPVGNAVENAYRRTDLAAKRAKLMQAWGAFCCPPQQQSDKVASLRA